MHKFPVPRSLREVLTDQEHTIDWSEDEYLHAFVERRLDGETSTVDAVGRPDNPLRGVPMAVKDVIRVDGWPTRAGSLLPPAVLSGAQASIVDRLSALGAVVAGKTVTAEFAISEPGPTVNPRDPSRTPGGSSSGSAAAVGAGLVPIALGTQTVGSVIRPAAYCGVVGFRPTWGALPTDGVIPNAPSFDTVGWFTADVESSTLVASALLDEIDIQPRERIPVLGVPSDDYLADADLGARNAYRTHLAMLNAAGISTIEVRLPAEMAELQEHVRVLQRFELAQAHAEWFSAYSDLYRPATAAAVREGQAITPRQYEASARWRQAFRERLRATAKDRDIDAWITPAATGLPPAGLTSTGSAVMCAPFSLAGSPAISIPTGQASDGLSYAVQLASIPGEDAKVLQTAASVETVFL